MKLLKVLTFWGLLASTGLGIAAVVAAKTVHGQRDDRPERHARGLTVLAGRGAAIGVSVRDVRPAEAGGERTAAGVLVDEVRPDSPAEKAGLKRGDIIVEFDGERVRSARQFSRVVQETPAGRPVKATVVRDGRRSDIEIVPAGGGDRFGDMAIYGDFEDYMRDLGREFGHLGDRQPSFEFNFDFDVPGVSARRLGVTVEELTGQLAVYFGANDGLLVTSVAEGSSGERAGLKAGDVITSVNGSRVRSRQDLLRSLRDLPDDDEVTLGIVRDKKETSVKTKVEAPRRTPRGRPA